MSYVFHTDLSQTYKNNFHIGCTEYVRIVTLITVHSPDFEKVNVHILLIKNSHHVIHTSKKFLSQTLMTI